MKATRWGAAMGLSSFLGMAAAVSDLPGWHIVTAVALTAFAISLHLATKAYRREHREARP